LFPTACVTSIGDGIMTDLQSIKRLAGAVALMLFCMLLTAGAEAQSARVDLVLENGNVLIYQGKQIGLKKGQVLAVTRGGVTVGAVEVAEITDAYARAIVVSGAGTVMEGDDVSAAPGSAAAIVSGQQVEAGGDEKAAGKKDEKKEETADKTEDSKTSSSRRSSRSSRSSSSKQDDKEEKSESSSSSSSRRPSRSRRPGSASASASEDDSESSSSRSRRPGGSSSSSRRPSSSSRSRRPGGGADEGEAEKEQIEAQAIKNANHYRIHVGYFYLNHNNLPGTVISDEPAPMISVDFWMPRKKNLNLVYSAFYTRPDTAIYYSNQRIDYQLRIFEFSAGLIWDNLGSTVNSDLYGGFMVGWRQAYNEIDPSITTDVVRDLTIKTMQGIDYHGVLGFEFREKTELRASYCFDEEYFYIDLGYKY